MTSDLAALLGVALAIYGLALALRRARLGGVATGLGIGIAFLGDGFLPAAMLLLLMAVLPVAHPGWRTREFALTGLIALLCAAPLVALWPVALWLKSPTWFSLWLEAATTTRWSSASPGTMLAELLYFLRVLPWYAWPAWPLAAWTVWRSRRMLAARKGVALSLTAFAVFFVVLTLFADAREVSALPLLVPLAILGVAEIDSLPRGGANALDWFGTTTFFLFAAVLWIGWVAVMTGRPEGALAWIRTEVPDFTHSFSFIAFAFAALLTLIWLVVIARSLRSPRRALVNWAAGITMVWMLVMTLGVPLIDQARSYRAVAAKLVRALPPQFGCVASRNLGDAQRALLDYFVALRTFRAESPAAERCPVLLVQVSTQKSPGIAPPGWSETWRGSRPGDRNEVFVLYRRDSR
jgi:4-amino-4-deoxy-L-arabinose transferase-like glycosyltransferase